MDSGNPLFLPAVIYSAGWDNPSSIAVADANGDRKLDLVVTKNWIMPVPLFAPVGVRLGNGDGTFQPVLMYSSDVGSGRRCQRRWQARLVGGQLRCDDSEGFCLPLHVFAREPILAWLSKVGSESCRRVRSDGSLRYSHRAAVCSNGLFQHPLMISP